jgi:hypothetical protein
MQSAYEHKGDAYVQLHASWRSVTTVRLQTHKDWVGDWALPGAERTILPLQKMEDRSPAHYVD